MSGNSGVLVNPETGRISLVGGVGETMPPMEKVEMLMRANKALSDTIVSALGGYTDN